MKTHLALLLWLLPLAPVFCQPAGPDLIFPKFDAVYLPGPINFEWDETPNAVAYELQDEEPGSQTVLVSGNTAVVTAKLTIKASVKGKPLDETLWFSDTYVRTPDGWRYFFGQASLPLPPAQN